MFDSDNPAECTRQAAMMLRSRGWKPVSVKQACEGFELADFHLGEHVAELFHKAQRGGISFSLNENPPQHAFLGNWFEPERSQGSAL